MSSRIEDLEPVTRAMCEEFERDCAAEGLAVEITHTRRTLDEQLHLWAKGRALKDGKWVIVNRKAVVTNAFPGSSAHNYGMAFDIKFKGPDPYLSAWEIEHKDEPNERDRIDPRWYQVGAIGEALGLSWGGPLGDRDRFTWDRPHFERKDWKLEVERQRTTV